MPPTTAPQPTDRHMSDRFVTRLDSVRDWLEQDPSASPELIADLRNLAKHWMTTSGPPGTDPAAAAILRDAAACLDSIAAQQASEQQALEALHMRNNDLAQNLLAQAKDEKLAIDRNQRKLRALRATIAQHGGRLMNLLGVSALKHIETAAHKAMIDSRLTQDVQTAMNGYFSALLRNLDAGAEIIVAIRSTLKTLNEKSAGDDGRNTVPGLSLLRYRQEIQHLEADYRQQIKGVISFLITNSFNERFFEPATLRASQIFELLERESETWLRGLLAEPEREQRELRHALRKHFDKLKQLQKTGHAMRTHLDAIAAAQIQLRQHQASLTELAELTKPN